MISGPVVFFLIMGGLLVFALWHIFASDYVTSIRRQYSENKSIKDKTAKIARVKLVSDDRKEIEKFVSDNATYLSDETVRLLVARIEAIKNDRIIADDDLKVRFEELNKPSELIQAESVPLARGTRGKRA
jgi:hypothetical protein